MNEVRDARLAELLRSPAAIIVAGVTMVGLLISLTVVVQGIRERSAVRHHAEAEQMRGRWQCAAMLKPAHRDNCRLQLASVQR